ncbi:MAG: STAS domain-containing protein, partial [Verrucomicrobiota bacterium]
RHSIRLVTKSTKSDAIVFATTFFTALLIRLDFAIIIGAMVSIILFLRKVSAPELVEYNFNEQGNLYEMEKEDVRPNPQISIVHVEGELFFGAAELFRDQMRRVCDDPSLKIVILRLKNAYHLDATSVMALEELIKYLNEKDRYLIVSGARKDVYRVFKNSGLIEILGKKNFFMGSTANPNMATRNALKRAQELLGDQKADVKIYYDPNKS